MAHIQQLHSQISIVLTQQLDSTAQTSRQFPPLTEPASQNTEPVLLEPLLATQLTALAPDVAVAREVPSQQVTSQPAVSSATTSQQDPKAQSSIPTGPPPSLCVDSDDIYWVNQLQTSLTNSGYYCGEEETEDFIFGPNTESAVMTFQVPACCLTDQQCLLRQLYQQQQHTSSLTVDTCVPANQQQKRPGNICADIHLSTLV